MFTIKKPGPGCNLVRRERAQEGPRAISSRAAGACKAYTLLVFVAALVSVLKKPLGTMETEQLDTTQETVLEPELSPVEQFRQQWRQQPGFTPFFKQRNLIDQNAELMPYAAVVWPRGWASPFAFACEGLVLVAIVLSFFNWYETRHSSNLQDQIVALQAAVQAEAKRDQGIRDAIEAEIKSLSHPARNRLQPVNREEALQQMQSSLEDSRKSEAEYMQRMAAHERELRSQQRAETIANSGTPLMFSLALVLAAGLVASGARRDYPRSNVRAAGDYYLYFATSSGLWLNLVFLVLLHFALSGNAWGLSQLSDTLGPPFWMLFWIGFYLLLLRYFASVARDMYTAMQIRPPASEWSLGNKLLLRINTSFLLMFVAVEAIFLSAAYMIYLIGRR